MIDETKWTAPERVEVDAGVELDKRTYTPGLMLRSKCLSYPTTGRAKEVHGYCDHWGTPHQDEKDAEWLVARVTVRIAVDVEYPA